MNPLHVEYRQVETLIPYARNPRTHSDAQIAKIAASIAEFGWTSPILVDAAQGVIAGHGRLAAARKLGLTDVPVIELAHLSPAQKRAYVIADNRLALDAGWDEELLAVELAELTDAGFDLALTGFDDAELQSLLNEFKAIRRDLGNPTELTTRDQSNLVAAINEVRALIDVTPGLNIIDDENPNAVSTTFSASGIVRRLDQLKADILGGADGAFDTLKELQDALAGDASGIAALTRALESRVRFDEPQDLTVDSQAQARQNIGAASAEAVGDTEVDLVALFRDALAA